MTIRTAFARKTVETLAVYWELVRIVVPVAVITQVLQDFGFISAVSPLFSPLMTLLGLPPELAFAWLTGLLVGIWGAVVVVFALVPASALSTADMTVLSALLLFAHAIPIEQRIIQMAGPGFVVTSAIRVGGGLIFALMLHHVLAATGWLSGPLEASWLPASESGGWAGFTLGLLDTLVMMLVVLMALSWMIELLKVCGVLDRMNRGLAPLFGFAGIKGEAVPFTAIGLLLGISYGGGLLIREARTARIAPRQVFLACVFMGFAHSIIEDTLLVVSLGADALSVFAGRLIFAVLATAIIARVVNSVPDAVFFKVFFRGQQVEPVVPETGAVSRVG